MLTIKVINKAETGQTRTGNDKNTEQKQPATPSK